MDIRILKEYKLKSERNNRPRQPIIFGERIYIIFVFDKKGVTQSKIQCLNIASFDLIWEFSHNHVVNNILISSNNTLIAGCMNGIILNINLENGEEIWRFKTDESNIGPISNVYENKIAFSGIQARAKSTWCLDIQNGGIIWKQSNKGHSYVPIIFNGYIYNCIGNQTHCLNLTDGIQVWTQYEPATYMFNPKIFKQFVIASGHGVVNFYDLKSGALKIRMETGAQSSIKEIISDENNIYFGDEKGFFYSYKILEKEASLNWKIDMEGSIQTVPAIIGKYILVINDSSNLWTIDNEKGTIINKKKVKGEGNISGITYHNSKIYFSCGGGNLYECEKK